MLSQILPVVNAVEGAVSQGLLWGLMALGVYLTFRILNIADMTVDGSFACGGAVTAVLITKGIDPAASLIFVFMVGLLCGLATGFMTTKLKINVLLASILTQIALYSVNLRIMGRSNFPLLDNPTMMNRLNGFLINFFAKMKHVEIPEDRIFYDEKVYTGFDKIAKFFTTTRSSLIIGLVIVLILVFVIYWFFGTEYGSAIRATGSNERMVRAMGVNTDTTKIAGLMIANGLVAVSGALVGQSQGYGDVQMGTGAIVIGLASIIIGEAIFGNRRGFLVSLVAVVVGSIIYRIVIALVLQMGLKSSDLKLLTALVVAIALSLPVIKKNLQQKLKGYKAPGSEVDTRHADADVKSKNEDSQKIM